MSILDDLYKRITDHLTAGVITAERVTTMPDHGLKQAVFLKGGDGGYKLVELPQQRPPTPSRLYTFFDVASFCNFLVRSEDFDPAATEILGQDGKVKAVSGPTWERHTAELMLFASDAWKFWQRAVQTRYDVKGLRALIKSRRADVLGVQGVLTDLQEVVVSVNKGQKVEIDPKTGIVATSRAEKNVQLDGKVPDHLRLSFSVFADAPASEFILDITPEMDSNDKLTFSLAFLDPDAVVRKAWTDRIEAIREGLGEGWLVGIGEIGFRA